MLVENKISLFKSHVQSVVGYTGGKAMSEVVSDYPIHKLSSNENPLGTSPLAIQAVKDSLKSLYIYPDNTDLRLRKALSDFYNGVLQSDQFVAHNSGVAILDLITNAFLDKGLNSIMSNPTFGPYHDFPKKIGADVIDVPLIDQKYLNVEGILNAINDNTRIIWLCSPNNPTGRIIPKSQVDQIVDSVPSHVVVVLDEVYYQYVDHPEYTRALPYVNAGKQVIGVNSFSKAYGMAGMRVGYCYSTTILARYMAKLQRPFLINTMSMNAAIAALNDVDFIKNTTELIKLERAYIYSEFDRLHLDYFKTQANFIFLRSPIDDIEFELKMQALGIMVRRTQGFGAPDCIRITIGNREMNEAMIFALENVLQNN